MGTALPALDFGPSRSAKSLFLGGKESCAVLDDGSARCWGHQSYPAVVPAGVAPLVVPTGKKIRAMSLGGQRNYLRAHVLDDGSVYETSTATKVDLGTGVKAVDVDSNETTACALLDDGRVKCWGYNAYGQLGLGDTEDRSMATPAKMGDALPYVDIGP